MRKFWKDQSGLAAIETAMILPFIVFGLIASLDVAQLANLKTQTAALATTACRAGSRYLVMASDHTKITADDVAAAIPQAANAAQAAFDSNLPAAFMFGGNAILSLDFVADGSRMTCNVAATASAIVPMQFPITFGDMSASATVVT